MHVTVLLAIIAIGLVTLNLLLAVHMIVMKKTFNQLLYAVEKLIKK